MAAKDFAETPGDKAMAVLQLTNTIEALKTEVVAYVENLSDDYYGIYSLWWAKG